jgi:hypothetical protein
VDGTDAAARHGRDANAQGTNAAPHRRGWKRRLALRRVSVRQRGGGYRRGGAAAQRRAAMATPCVSSFPID